MIDIFYLNNLFESISKDLFIKMIDNKTLMYYFLLMYTLNIFNVLIKIITFENIK